MSKGGGGGGSTTTVQKADPWVGLQGPLNTLYGNAVGNFNSGGPNYYPGNTVAPSNWPIEASLNWGQDRAQQNPYAGMLGTAQSNLQTTAQGRSPWENPGFGQLNNFQQGSYLGSNPAQGGTSQLASNGGTFGKFGSGGYAGTNPAQSYFQNSTNGSFLDKQNPYLSGLVDSASRPVIDNFQKAIAPSLASQFSMAGRNGSGAHTSAFGTAADSLGRNLGDISTNIYGTAYENERNRQQGAASQLANMGQFDLNQIMQGAQGQLGALGTLSNMNQFDRSQQMQGANAVSDQYNQERGRAQGAALAAPGFAQQGQAMDFDRISKLLGVGQYRQGQQQDLINANKERFDFNQNRPNMNLQQLNQILQGGMSLNGSTSQSNQNMQRNPFASGLGGAMLGSSLAPGITSMFPALAGVGAGPFALGGALLGGLFG